MVRKVLNMLILDLFGDVEKEIAHMEAQKKNKIGCTVRYRTVRYLRCINYIFLSFFTFVAAAFAAFVDVAHVVLAPAVVADVVANIANVVVAVVVCMRMCVRVHIYMCVCVCI